MFRAHQAVGKRRECRDAASRTTFGQWRFSSLYTSAHILNADASRPKIQRLPAADKSWRTTKQPSFCSFIALKATRPEDAPPGARQHEQQVLGRKLSQRTCRADSPHHHHVNGPLVQRADHAPRRPGRGRAVIVAMAAAAGYPRRSDGRDLRPFQVRVLPRIVTDHLAALASWPASVCARPPSVITAACSRIQSGPCQLLASGPASLRARGRPAPPSKRRRRCLGLGT